MSSKRILVLVPYGILTRIFSGHPGFWNKTFYRKNFLYSKRDIWNKTFLQQKFPLFQEIIVTFETGRFPGNILFHLSNPYIGIFGRGTMYGKYSLFQIDNNLWLWKQGFSRKLLVFQIICSIRGFLDESLCQSLPPFHIHISLCHLNQGFPREPPGFQYYIF